MTRLLLAACPHHDDPVALGRMLRDAGHEVVHGAGVLDLESTAASAVQEDVGGVVLAIADCGERCAGRPGELADHLATRGAADVEVLVVAPADATAAQRLAGRLAQG